MPWRFVLAATDGTNIAELGGATARTVTWNLDDACTATFTLPGTDKVAGLIEETASDLLAYSPTNSLKFRGRLGSSGDDVSSAGHVSNFSAVDYRGFLARRFVWPGTFTTYSGVEQTSIAWQMIANSQGLPGGDMGITDGSITTGVNRTRTVSIGDEILQSITDLANLTDGFDWEIGPDLVLRTFYPYRGNVNGIFLSYGAEIVSFQRVVDTGTFANAVRYSGDSALTPATAVASTFGGAGRWEIQVGDTTILDQTFLNSKATFELNKDRAVTPTYVVTLRPGWWTPENLWLGDIATLSLKSGRLDVLVQLRVSQIALTIGDDGGETVAITFSGVPLNGAPNPADAATAKSVPVTTTGTVRNLKRSVTTLQRR